MDNHLLGREQIPQHCPGADDALSGKAAVRCPLCGHAFDPGTVEGNPVFIYHDAFNPDKAEVEDFKQRYREGKVGDVDVKQSLAKAINNLLAPMRERYAHYAADTGFVDQVILDGTETMRSYARETMQEVRKAMGFAGSWNRLRRSAEKRAKKQG